MPSKIGGRAGDTPLCMAAANGHIEVAAKLLEHGSTDPNQATKSGYTPHKIATERGHTEIAAML